MKYLQTLKLNRFYIYQKDRFPLAVIILSLIPPLLSSASVIKGDFNLLEIVAVLLVSVMYLLHIRILDEQRDFDHDNLHHPDRLIQKKIISLQELKKIDACVSFCMLVLSLLLGTPPFLLCIIMLGYSFLAKNEFFLGEKLRKHFFIYNTVNLLQMFIMQIFVYSVFLNYFKFNYLILLHFLFTCVGTIAFEFLRKLKVPGEDGTGKDTYTYYIQFDRAIVIHVIFMFVNSALFFWITTLHKFDWKFAVLAFIGFVTILLSSVIHLLHKVKDTDKLLQLVTFLVYVTFNLAIYFISFS